MASRTSKMVQYINYRMRITVADGRQLVGRFLAFDRHMNVVLGDAEEFRNVGGGGGGGKDGAGPRQERRVLGLVILRGENVRARPHPAPPAAVLASNSTAWRWLCPALTALLCHVVCESWHCRRSSARRAYFFHLARRFLLPTVPLLISVASLLIGAASPRAYMWGVVPLWYFVNVLIMVYPFSVLFPSQHTR